MSKRVRTRSQSEIAQRLTLYHRCVKSAADRNCGEARDKTSTARRIEIDSGGGWLSFR